MSVHIHDAGTECTCKQSLESLIQELEKRKTDARFSFVVIVVDHANSITHFDSHIFSHNADDHVLTHAHDKLHEYHEELEIDTRFHSMEKAAKRSHAR